jgi:DNA-binding transcriptional MocR family regulator
MKKRHAILQSVLGASDLQTFSGALHAFLTLPAKWPRAEFITGLLQKGIRTAPSDSFAVSSSQVPNALRLSIGAPATADELRLALQVVAGLYEGEAAFASHIV